MLDRHGREIDYLRLSVTGSCDCRCPYCVPPGEAAHRPPLLSVDELTELARAAAACGVRKIRLTGGEPLLREDIVALCRGIAALPGVEELCLTTNGIRLSRLAPELKRAGASRLNVSLDSLVPERFQRLTGHDGLDEVLRGIDAVQSAGFAQLKLNVVLMADINDGEITDLISFASQKAMEIRFIELMPVGPCAAFAKAHYLPAHAVLAACPALRSVGADGVSEVYALPGQGIRVGLIRPISHTFCTRCSRIRIDSGGVLRPCLHSTDGVPLRGLHGRELEEAIRAGIQRKPQGHTLSAGAACQTQAMYQIGG